MIGSGEIRSKPAGLDLDQIWNQAIQKNFRHLSFGDSQAVWSRAIELGFWLAGGKRSDSVRISQLQYLQNTFRVRTQVVELEGNPFERIHQGPFSEAVKLQIIAAMIEASCSLMRASNQNFKTSLPAITLLALRESCEQNLQLRGGSLMSLFLQLGAIVGSSDPGLQSRIKESGLRLGAALQRRGELLMLSSSSMPKSLREDLLLGRPHWVWVLLKENLSAQEWRECLRAVESFSDEMPWRQHLGSNSMAVRAEPTGPSQLSQVIQKIKGEFSLRENSPASRIFNSIPI